MKITGHLCSVTYGEAADLGIDNLEHGFLAATDFVADKQPDVCPGQAARPADDRRARRERRAVQGAREEARRQASRADVDADRVRDVHARPSAAAGARRAAAAAARSSSSRTTSARAQNQQSVYATLFPKAMRARARVRARPAALLIAGTDPTGGGGVDPGLRESAPDRAARRGRVHAARSDHDRHAERRDISRPRRADRIDRRRQAGGSASSSTAIRPQTIADVHNVETVFKQGVGFDPAKLIESVKGKVGLW